MLYSMKQTCQKAGMTYEALKFYCNQGLVPNVKRDKNNYRVFDEHDIEWIKGLICLKRCGMSLADMKHYLALCLKGKSSIPQRKEILTKQRDFLVKKMENLQEDIAYIDGKQNYYDDVLSGKIQYTSNLIHTDEE
ncbi:MerR family transcriptional regulator [Butyricicoccus pullicaecorum]|uniref:MerR family transcriptional regulator n=1 Tax=Butyricicoccus pullicaecorum TaxID=501571 RepID=A0A1Y4L334_9FIRM|nr:MerR family transcriptional regulator [Butyricicoccus pullicaecorum]OUP50250.1 MerR family transcriptional regulator [Butyricicoccus pullicaecorum]